MAQELKAEGQQVGASAIGKEAKVADAYEAARQQVEQEAAQELVDGQRHQLFLVAVRGVVPAKGHLTLVERDESVVGNGDAILGIGSLRSRENVY
jgi:hypothetical protein